MLGTVCVQCPNNTYSSKASPQCTVCDVNAVAEPGSTSYTSCNCNSRYFRDGSRCIRCPAGIACRNNAALPCGQGTYSVAFQSVCTQCDAGKYQNTNGSSVCNTCPAGTTVKQTTYVVESKWPDIVSRSGLDTGSMDLYIMLNKLTDMQTYNITSWAFYGSTVGCEVTPHIFEGTYTQGALDGSLTFNLKATGATRTVTAVGAQNFTFGGSDPTYTVPLYPTTITPADYLTVSFFGWS
ncbi:MAG: hypothetical protein JZU63_02330, partial [Rhodoferax sp.]|nr:hypothetical protein [Rhodoferax sp.]